MLTDDVGRRPYLKVVLLVMTGNEIRVMEGNAVVGVRTEEKRLRRFCSSRRRTHVGPE